MNETERSKNSKRSKIGSSPLFSINLGSNGGIFEPESIDELARWLESEAHLWTRVVTARSNSRDFRSEQQERALDELRQAARIAGDFTTMPDVEPSHLQRALDICRHAIELAFINVKLPHSSTPLYKRIAVLADEDPLAAKYFLAAYLGPATGTPIQPTDLQAWRGLIEGLIERHGLIQGVISESLHAKEAAVEQLRQSAENLVAIGKRTVKEFSIRNKESVDLTSNLLADQTRSLEKMRSDEIEKHAALLADHDNKLNALRKAYREDFALSEPVNYWKSKRDEHVLGITKYSKWVFGGIAATAVLALAQIGAMVVFTESGKTPDPWRVGTLALTSLFAVWAVRLLVRMYLSHHHLANDANERVVMVQTYLSLTEGDKLTSDEHRKLILQALFRPATDGIVKDEGIPASVFELLTRTGK